MSINVTVTGNPVSINRGSMVTGDPDYAKKEFDRRRKIRLAQVRQQANNIAENVRKKVRKEREKQLSEIEQRGAEKLEKWKNRKMLELQEQYCESIKDLGLGHAQAIVEETRDEIADAYKETVRKKSKLRGEDAARKLHEERQDKLRKQAEERQRKMLAKSVDNFRVETKKSKKSPFRKKKVRKSGKSTGAAGGRDSDSDFRSSDYEDGVPALDIGSIGGTSSLESRNGGKRYRTKSRSPPVSPVSSSTMESDIREVPPRGSVNGHTQQDASRQSTTPPRSPSPPKMADIIVHHPLDTRISDRIRSRRLPANLIESKATSYLDEEDEKNQVPVTTSTVTEFDMPQRRCNCCPGCCLICTCNSCNKESTTDDFRKAKLTQYPSSVCVCNCRCGRDVVNKSSKGIIADLAPSREEKLIGVTSLEKKKSLSVDSKVTNGEIDATTENGRKETCQPQKCDKGGRKQPVKNKTCDCGHPSCKCDKKNFNNFNTNLNNNRLKDIPQRPTVSLKSAQKKPSETEVPRVQYYDHRNRFTKEYVAPESQVQKIPDENIEIEHQSSRSEAEYLDRMYQRDRDAQIRGRKALEKNRIHKEYQELLQKLPALQRQERIASINLNNPSFHMGDERLRQRGEKKQCRMEDAYDKLFPNTVTIAPKTHVLDDRPFRTVDIAEGGGSDTILNVARWELSAPVRDGVTVTKEDGVIKINPNVSDQTDSLRYMLEKLKKQKEMLMKEVEGLPMDSNLDSIIEDLERLREPTDGLDAMGKTSSTTSADSDAPTSKKTRGTVHKKRSKHNVKHKRVQHSSSNEATGSPTRKIHRKIQRIILQSTSTQTSPKIGSSPAKKHPKKHDVTPKQSDTIPPTKTTVGTSPFNQLKTTIGTSPMNLKTPSEQAIEAQVVEGQRVESERIVEAQYVEAQIMETQQRKISHKHRKAPAKSEKAKLCDCSKSVGQDGEVCEILIKIKDDEEPEIKIKSPTKKETFSDKETITVHQSIAENGQKTCEMVDSKCQTKCWGRTVRIDESSISNRRSWRQELSRNETMGTSSSTSYYSPPDFRRRHCKRRNSGKELNGGGKELNPRLVTYIKKLLSMSRASVEDLGMSTGTDISVSSSLANSIQSDPLTQLRNVMRFFKLSPDDLAQCYCSESSRSDASSSRLSYDASESNANQYSESNGNQHTESDANKNRISDGSLHGESYARQRSDGNCNVEKTTSQEGFDEQLAEAARKYQDMAIQCQERISTLTAAIEKVREEKKQILTPEFSDRENSTAYMNLPSHLEGENSNNQSNKLESNRLESSVQSSGSEREQQEIDRQLLSVEIDMAKLRIPTNNTREIVNHEDPEMYQRYRRLIAQELQISDSEQTEKKLIVEEVSQLTNDFVPMLQDIPRLPKLPFNQSEFTQAQADGSKKKPPPAKGITAAKRFNGNITSTAHELSTIAEVDSQLRLGSLSPQKPEKSDGFETILAAKSDGAKLSEESMPDIVQEISSGSQSKSQNQNENKTEQTKSQTACLRLSDTESSDMENIEAMLISMGMGWAVSTLKKTQEALVRAASSSDGSQRLSENSSTSDVTLRDFLGKKLLFNNSSGMSSGSPFTRELEEISVIQGSGLSIDNRQHQRTSTPVQKGSDKSNSVKMTFSGESEPSSVKTPSDEAFATIPNYSELPDED